MAKSGTPLRREANFPKTACCHLDRLEHRFGDVLDTTLGRPGPAFGGPRAAKNDPRGGQKRFQYGLKMAQDGLKLQDRPRRTTRWPKMAPG